MRQAKADDYWRRSFARAYSVRCEQVRFENLLGLGSNSVEFAGGMTAIVGGNGVGKSTIVAAITELLGGAEALEELDHERRLKGSTTVATLISPPGGPHHPKAVPDGEGRKIDPAPPEGFSFVWLDPAYRSAQSRKLVARDQNFADVLEPLAPKKLNDEELERFAYVVGKEYEAIEVFEVPDYGDIEVFPYFRVTAGGIVYGSETMGQGELSLMFVLWALLVMPKNSVLLLEEPETHVSPRSQQSLMNVVAEAAAEKAAWIVVTTHSPTVISRIPVEHVRLLTREGADIHVIKSPRQYQLAQVLVGAQGYQGMVLVEDELAKEMLIGLLDETDPDLLRQYEIAVAGDAQTISSNLRALPSTRRWFTLIGAYDGDQKGHVNSAGFRWPHAFLPTDQAPDVFLKAAALASGAASLGVISGKAVEDVRAAFDAAVGLEPHDWIHRVAAGLGLPFALLVRYLTRVWLQRPGSVASCEEFIKALKAAPEKAHAAA